jgi:hypothetical protein
MPINMSGYSLNTGAIAVGVTIAVIFVIIAALLFYQRRRWRCPPAPPASNGQPSGLNPHMDQVPGATSTSMLRHYVCDFMTPAPLMCAHVFVSVITLRTRMTQLRTQSTKEVRRIGCIILFNHLPRRPAEFYIPLSPRRSPKDRVVCTCSSHMLGWPGRDSDSEESDRVVRKLPPM